MSEWEGLTPPYRTIVADPPWPVRWQGGPGGRRRHATGLRYSTMDVDAISALPVQALADSGAHLYLWVTAGLNRAGIGLQVAQAWGFRVVGEIVWSKRNFGAGAFPRSAHEILLVASRGVLPFARRDVGSVQEWPQFFGSNGGKTHSSKPAASFDLIESASPGPDVELFCRQSRFGWDSWGYGYENLAVTP